jgi:hypothetical protein
VARDGRHVDFALPVVPAVHVSELVAELKEGVVDRLAAAPCCLPKEEKGPTHKTQNPPNIERKGLLLAPTAELGAEREELDCR